ncbi:polyketide synthase [Fusarium austroafricanum]|uniref:Polyketide synthase n=1 Tax=Fusarium austroafricanum TaxID=2364996 RepID=A0A8H4JV61_9HYPO|nr:polyketide synthase [Fusarium austroafricanum]
MVYSHDWLKGLLDSGTYSDLTLTTKNKVYAAHRAIACSQSSVIKAKCDFQDRSQAHSCDTCGAAPKYSFEFLDDDPETVDCLIQHLYLHNYQSIPHKPREESNSDITREMEETPEGDTRVDDSHPTFHVRVYAIAEKYDVMGLKDCAIREFEEVMKKRPSSEQFINSAEEAYTSTIPEDKHMRNAIVRNFHAHPEWLDEKCVQDVIQKIPQLLYDLLMCWHGNYTQEVKHDPIDLSEFLDGF